MKEYKHFIGIDISKDKLDIHVLQGKDTVFSTCIANTIKELAALAKKLKKMDISLNKSLICCEHTGIYTSSVLSWTGENGFHLWLEKAIQIKKSIGLQRGKNDEIDAQRIAMYAFRFQDKAALYEMPSNEIARLKRLLASRNRLLNAKNTISVPLNELKRTLNKKEYQEILKENKPVLAKIKESLKATEKKIKEIIEETPELSKTMEFATSVDGVGDITAAYLVAVTNNFKLATSGKGLACYAGFAPFEYQSGSSVRGRNRVSHFANKTLKALLHMCALSAIVYSEEMRDYYERKVKEGKHKMVVINAIRNKIIKRVYACVTQERKYEKNYTRSLA